MLKSLVYRFWEGSHWSTRVEVTDIHVLAG